MTVDTTDNIPMLNYLMQNYSLRGVNDGSGTMTPLVGLADSQGNPLTYADPAPVAIPGIVMTQEAGPFPVGATPVNAFATASNNTASAAIQGVVGKYAYVTGIDIVGTGATAGSVVTAQLQGLLGGTLSIPIGVPAGVTSSIVPISLRWKGLIGATVSGQIALSVPAFGTGNASVGVAIYGYVR